MKNRIIIGLLSLALFLLLGSAKPIVVKNDTTTLIISKIEIKISGTSTVGKYNCTNTFYKKDSIILNLNEKNYLKADIPMLNFDCGNKVMTKDLRKTIMCKKFPNSNVTITDIKVCNTDYRCNLSFLITNKTLKYKDFILHKVDNKIHGTIHLNFSDIDLEPPVKMAGLIKVRDEIVIDFSLYNN
ncbi:hypothetical protein [Flavobacterium frigoris]|uniref:Lipid/polyisoprenoid-binding YceI-like domain-containing protein n=1 Tax=Flavobacterium frigoris (strain PS1) TaxID=1086011 RepID=H7FQU2_FLAFP|nr:hypothetical protein [Flavobacterium frigoris]EIA09079.1 hypothetical protein HJ01_01465 [Flavobacterium frigoris PS1]